MTNHRHAVAQFRQRGAGNGFALANLALQLPDARLLYCIAAILYLSDLTIQVVDLIDASLNLAAKLFPPDRTERNSTDRKRGFHLRAVTLAYQTLPGTLVRGRRLIQLFLHLL